MKLLIKATHKATYLMLHILYTLKIKALLSITLSILLSALLCNMLSNINSAYALENNQIKNNQHKVDSLVKGFSFNYDKVDQLQNKKALSSVNKSFGRVSLDGFVKSHKTNDNSYYVGLHLKLKQGWHLYWISAGSAGLPTTIKLNQQDSINIQSATISYPQPTRMITLGENIAGYKGNVYLPIHILFNKLKKIQRSTIKIKTTIFVCKEQCIRRDITLSTKISQLNDPNNAKNLNIALNKLPIIHKINPSTLQAHYKIISKYKGLISVKTLNNISDVFLYHQGLNIDKPTITNPQEKIKDKQKTSKLFTFKVNGIDMLKDKIDVYMTRNNSFYLVKNLAISPQQTQENTQENTRENTQNILFNARIYYTLFLSLLAGLILNVMPCVLPVLGLKILSLTRNTKQPKTLLLFMSLGMISTFSLLGLLLLICKYLGYAIGWGMQFQSVTFTISMAILMLIIALFMLFDISLLSKINAFNQIFNKILNFFHNKIPLPKDKTSAFLNGVLATILATPCTAPFMGGVISYSLTLPMGLGLFIYIFLGMGMASPFLLATTYPNLAKNLTKLTKFHNKIFLIKRLLFIPMIATALWLTTIAYHQITTTNQPEQTNQQTNPNSQDPHIKWHKFQPNKIQALVKSGKSVFVDITADWCLTCKVNEKFVLYTKQGKNLLFNTKNTYPMQADWTNPNKKISTYLSQNHRYSLPFYKIYTPQNPKGKLLPVILTPQTLQQYLPPPTNSPK